jgi:prolyl-tRNA editing enzyme YbaK/EbsC (Cys-tRNA(Pro) deacylase)
VVRIRKAGEKFFVMLVLPGDQRFDNEKAKKLFGAKDIRFAAEEEVGQITNGIKLGGVPPFGNLFGLKTYVDPSLMKNEKIVFNAGDQRFSIAMKAKDYIELLNAEITNFV